MNPRHWSAEGMDREARGEFMRLTVRCEACKGAGFHRAWLLASPKQVAQAAGLPAFKGAPVPIEFDTCSVCQGAGRITHAEACRR